MVGESLKGLRRPARNLRNLRARNPRNLRKCRNPRKPASPQPCAVLAAPSAGAPAACCRRRAEAASTLARSATWPARLQFRRYVGSHSPQPAVAPVGRRPARLASPVSQPGWLVPPADPASRPRAGQSARPGPGRPAPVSGCPSRWAARPAKRVVVADEEYREIIPEIRAGLARPGDRCPAADPSMQAARRPKRLRSRWART